MHDFDYPQIQPRLAAIISGAEPMMDAIRKGWDIHSANAYNMYKHKDPNATYEAITAAKEAKEKKERALTAYEKQLLKFRDGAKTVGLGALFGEGPTKMSHQLGISVDEAKELIRTFFRTYPEIDALVKQMHNYAHETETTHTMLGRIRRLHQINNEYNRGKVAAEERIAFNTIIQGSEMEVMKCAMLQIHHNKELRQMGFRLSLTVHDELIGFSPKKVSPVAFEKVKGIMAKPLHWGPIQIDLPVPVDPDGAYGANWAAIH
jgi:DNA polymerase-1